MNYVMDGNKMRLRIDLEEPGSRHVNPSRMPVVDISLAEWGMSGVVLGEPWLRFFVDYPPSDDGSDPGGRVLYDVNITVAQP